MASRPLTPRHIVFVTGTRAELGLMLRTLAAISANPRLKLSIIATGMHLDPRAGPRLSALKAAGLTADVIVPWPRADTPARLAEVAGLATARLARAFAELKADIVLVVGDRVEAFAAASAAHLARIPLAHIHGGDRAEGQVDDSLRHAITKLAQLHFAASQDAYTRLIKLGERPETLHLVGAPGVEAIRTQAARSHPYGDLSQAAVVLLHPTSPDEALEFERATTLLRALRKHSLRTLLLLPNTDPGNPGIHRAWHQAASSVREPACELLRDLPRPVFLSLLRDCRLLAGNSSAGIIEAASFGTPVLDVGPRQSGRLHGRNVTHCSYRQSDIERALRAILRKPRPAKSDNPYEGRNTARRIARTLAAAKIGHPAPPKLISY